MAQSGGASSGQFVTQQQPGAWLASKLIGTTVVSANNESIGDVNDVLLDRNGQALAVVVGVGGFLGIGEKDVAVSFQQLEFTSRAATSSTSTTGAGSRSTATGATGSTTTTTSGAGTGATATATATDGNAPDRIVLRMTKQDLQNAPRFARGDRLGSTSEGSGSRTGGERGTTGTAPAAPGGGNAAPRQ